jgi:hypothetical protein
MRLILLSLILICMSFNSISQQADQVVQQQLEAYNARDIDAFMAVFHADIELWTLGAEKPSASGFENVRDIYKNLFESSPELHSIVLNRSVIGNKVIDYERISGRKGSTDELFLVMIYEVREGKIWKAWAVRE